jgi:hypothetical protein
VSKKSEKVAGIIDAFRGRRHDAHYLAYFECFNTGLYYEAHDVLEELWLADKTGPAGNFYKGLIQFAGAFVHLQRHGPQQRLRPAARLFGIARANLNQYPTIFEDLNVSEVLRIIDDWVRELERGDFETNPLKQLPVPKLRLAQP